jgi:parallel beta helix pectate lyase-like protein
MKRILALVPLAVLMLLLAAAAPAQAQATRTWVSSTGDDANTCTRSAPCRTFSGALVKTDAGGEINVVDSGSYGVVTIDKAITIANDGAGSAGVLGSGTNGIVVNAGTSDVVVLRGLDIEGHGTGLSGIKVLSAGVVHVENCTINNFTQKGIDFEPSAAFASTSQLHVSDTIVRDNVGASSGGIIVKPGANVSVKGSIENTQLRNNQFGLRVEDNSQMTAKTTTAAGNVFSGFIAVSVAVVATLNLDSCVVTGNGFGVKADNPNATARITNCTIAGNPSGGITTTGGGKVVSFGNNYNADAGAPTGTIAPQ